MTDRSDDEADAADANGVAVDREASSSGNDFDEDWYRVERGQAPAASDTCTDMHSADTIDKYTHH